MRLTILLVLLAGCAHPEFTHPSEFYNQNDPFVAAKRMATRKALVEQIDIQHRRELRMDYVRRMRETRTNYPPYLIPKK